MISARRLSDLLAALYAAPTDDTHWQVFLDGLCEEIQAQIGIFSATNVKNGSGEILAQGGIGYNPEMQRRYNEYYGQVDPYRLAFMRNPRIGPIVGEELVAPKEAEKTEFYNDLAIPTGVRHAMVLPAALMPNGVEAISVWRAPSQQTFDGPSFELFELLLPHIQAALKTRRLLHMNNIHVGRLQAALDSSGTAIFILSDTGKIVHWNRCAELLLRLQDGLALKQERLHATNVHAHKVLRTLIASAAIASGASLSQPGGVVAIPRLSSKRPFSAIVSPLRLTELNAPGHVLVLVTDPDRQPASESRMFAGLYGLTNAEARLARVLAAGDSLKEAADQLGVAESTVKSQLKSIFAKTGTSRQAQLVRLILRTSPIVHQGPLAK